MVHLADQLAVGYIALAILACGQAAEIGGLRLPQTLERLLIRQQVAQRFKTEQMGIERCRERVACRLQLVVQTAQTIAVSLGELEESLAFAYLLRVEARSGTHASGSRVGALHAHPLFASSAQVHAACDGRV